MSVSYHHRLGLKKTTELLNYENTLFSLFAWLQVLVRTCLTATAIWSCSKSAVGAVSTAGMLFSLFCFLKLAFNVFSRSCFRSHSHDDRGATSRSHRVPGYGLQVWEHPNRCLPLGWIINQDLGKVKLFWSKYLQLLFFSSLLADNISPLLPPTTPGARREAAPGRLTRTTERVTPTLRPHTGRTGSRKLPRLQKSATSDRGTTCPSKKSRE